MESARTASNTMSVCYRTVDGVRVRCAESDGPPDRTVVLTSPWPESVYAFAPIWASLAEHARLFAVDLPGFDASERREGLLSPQAMGEFLGAPHFVAPDVGTAAAPFAAAAAHPERIASAIVGTGEAAVPIQLGEPLASWVLDPGLDKYRRTDRARLSARRWTPSPEAYQTTSARTTWPATTATASPSQCAMSVSTRGAARACQAAAADHSAGHDHQRPPRPPRPAPPTRNFSTSDCPPAALRSSMPATSSRRRSRQSTPRPSSTPSRATGHNTAQARCPATREPASRHDHEPRGGCLACWCSFSG